MQSWQARCLEAVTYGAPGLERRRQVRRTGLQLDRILGDHAPALWANDFDQLLVPGVGFQEVAFFHRLSQTLILADIIQNLEAHKLPYLVRSLANLIGVLAPNGRGPIYLRAAIKLKKRAASEAARKLIAFQPLRVIFSHGDWFEQEGSSSLREALDWLL